MRTSEIERRRAAERASLTALRDASSILRFSVEDPAPDFYHIQFRGKGLMRVSASSQRVVICETHEIDLRLPAAYPDVPPGIRWMTPIFHPNISYGGFVEPAGIGFEWRPELNLDVLCERLWDVARGAYLDLDQAVNYAARDWFGAQRQFQLPVDPRPLRDLAKARSLNVFRYQRKGTGDYQVTGPQSNDVFFIGEDTPVPHLPDGRPWPRSRRDDILFIGEDENTA